MTMQLHLNIKFDINELKLFIEQNNFDKIFILTDENTSLHCLPIIKNFITEFYEIKIKSGEANKNLDTCKYIWEELFKQNASRKSLLINLGGGVITDMGAFIASVFKRGISCINIPTSLLSMVDASVGAKTGIDFFGIKNSLGTFYEAKMTIIDSSFLDTLPKRHIQSGFVEMLKHGIIADLFYFKQLLQISFDEQNDWNRYIKKSIEIKSKIVLEDPAEKGIRKILNFGHSVGHALESYFLNTDKTLYHGEAILYGMKVAMHLSIIKNNADKNILAELEIFSEKTNLAKKLAFDKNEIIQLLTQDKKNNNDEFLFVLINEDNQAEYDRRCTKEEILNALNTIHA
jgi:3-dehydroquinate synthase